MFKASKRTLIAALAVAAAVAPSTASARFLLNDPVSGAATSGQSVSAAPHASQPGPSTSGAFDWGDAGIGAAAAVALMGGATVALGGRRRRGHTASVI
jgi:hypothetical protein